MTRFGVMKHLGVLEEAGLVTTVNARPREAPLPQPGADPPRARPLDQQVRRADRRCDVSPQDTVGDPDGHLSTTSIPIYIKAPPDRVWQRDHRRRRHRPLLLRHAGRVRLDGRLPADLRLSGRLARRRRRRRSSSSPAGARDVLPSALGSGDRRRGPDPDDLAGRAGRGGRVEAHGHERARPNSKSAESFAGGIVYIVSGLKTLIETGEPLTVR